MVLLSGNPAFGQSETIEPDNTLGAESSRVIPLDSSGFPIDSIQGGAVRGGNLFHSFERFNVEQLRSAYFINPSNDIQNILSRVTGGNPSEILGTLGILNNPGVTSSPNLIFSNPNGIVFGEGASLDVPGSFVATTANAVKLGEQGFFSATEPERSSLLSVEPSALFFNAVNNQAGIVNRSTATGTVLGFAANGDANRPINGLQVLDGKSLLLVGGDVSLDGGRLFAPGGRVELGGLSEAGIVGLGFDGDILSLSFPDGVERGDVSLKNGSRVDTQAGNAGIIAINAQDVGVSGGSSIVVGIGQGLGTIDSQAGDVNLNATGEINVVGSVIGNVVQQQAIGNAGNINIDAGSLQLLNGAGIAAPTFGKGKAGNVKVRVSNSISLVGASILSIVDAGSVGDAGNIDINSASLSIQNGAQLSTAIFETSGNMTGGEGNAGNVNINVTGAVTITGERDEFPSGILSQILPGAKGNGGNITINSGSFSLNDNALITTSTFGEGNAGNVTVNVSDFVSFADTAAIQSTVGTSGVGKGGDININGASLSITNGAQLQTLVREFSGNLTSERRDAGNVNIKGVRLFCKDRNKN